MNNTSKIEKIILTTEPFGTMSSLTEDVLAMKINQLIDRENARGEVNHDEGHYSKDNDGGWHEKKEVSPTPKTKSEVMEEFDNLWKESYNGKISSYKVQKFISSAVDSVVEGTRLKNEFLYNKSECERLIKEQEKLIKKQLS